MTRRIGFFPILVASFATTVAFTLPSGARAADAVTPFEIVRTGDRAMSCTALAGEINGLVSVQPADIAPKPKKKSGLGFLRAISSVVPMAGGLGSVGGSVLSTAAGAASSMAAEDMGARAMDQANASVREAMTGGSPQQQRRERLTALFDQKGC